MEITSKLALEEAAVINEGLLLEASAASSLTLEYVLKDLAAGSLAGIANVVSGHPFDTVKVRMQMIQTRLGSCVKSMIAREGMSSFYKGVHSPLYSLPAINAVVFGSYEIAKRTLATNSGSEMTLTQGMLAGAWAGLLNCLIVTPVELVKCRQQMEGMGRKNSNTGTLAMMKQIARRHGLSGLYKGNLITIFREVPSYAIQFGSYELVKEFLASKYGASTLVNFVAGSVAGFMCWAASYPQDVIKTKLQCDFGHIEKRYFPHRLINDGGIINCAKDIYRHEGFRGFWRGFSACGIRAAIANAFTFVAYEEAKKLFM